MFPIDEVVLAKQVFQETLEGALKDNVGARILRADGSYIRCVPVNNEPAVESQKIIAQSRLRNTQQLKHAPREFPPKS